MVHIHEPMTPTSGGRDARSRAMPDRDHLPRLRRAVMAQDRQAGVGIPARPRRPPDRGLRAGARLGGALLPGRLRADPERRPDPGARPTPARASTSSSSAGRSRGRGCRCSSAPGRRSIGATGTRLRVIGADPLAVRLLFSRLRVSGGRRRRARLPVPGDLTAELLRAKALVAPSLGGESFGMVLTRAFACATPVVASDISGYRGVMEPDARAARAARRPSRARAPRVAELLADEPRRRAARTRRPRDRRASATRGTRSPAGSARSTRAVAGAPGRRRGAMRLPPAVGPARAALLVGSSRRRSRCSSGAGPDWGLVGTPSRSSCGAGSSARSCSTCSRWSRARSPGTTVIEQAMPPPRPRFRSIFSAFGVGLFANAVLPGRIGELARVAVLTRQQPRSGAGRLGDPRRHRLRPPRLRPLPRRCC